MRDGTGSPERNDTIVCDGESLSVEDVVRVSRWDAPVTVATEARERVRRSRERVRDVLGAGETVYGLNTGFGELVDERISPEDVAQLQTNLVRSHAAGAGRELTHEEVRAMLVTRVNSLVKGYSGIREQVVDLLVEMLNAGVHPVVKSRGSLGASGDLAPLAHMSLVLVGEGTAEYNGDRLPGAEALAAADLNPVTLKAKEGLALINGTQLTAGLAALIVFDARRAVRAADAAGALTTEVTMGTTASADPAIQQVRPHSGQTVTARNIKRLTADSGIVESHRNCDRVQDAYSIRCLPQVHGAVRDAIAHLGEAVAIELNSATDNPLVFDGSRMSDQASGTDEASILSGGNFHGASLAHRLDYVLGAITDLAAICERRIDRMLNPNVQEPHLPPFLTERSGLNSGYMLAQYTAAALVNANRSIGRAGTDNVPVSGNQEDHVSMSAQAAFNARRAVDNAITVVGIELLCGAQAAEFIVNTPEIVESRDEDLTHGVGTTEVYKAIRADIPPLIEDRPIHEDIERVDALVRSRRIEDVIADILDSPLE